MLKSLIWHLLAALGVVVILFALLPVICLVFSIDMAELMRNYGGFIIGIFTALPFAISMSRSLDASE